MRGMTFEEFKAMAQEHPYYRGRWPYFARAILMASEIEPEPETVLELGPGPGRKPVMVGADTMDWSRAGICHDAMSVPWPLADKAYDLFIALQVWEHLDGFQVEAFAEARRIARRGLLSFPVGWSSPRHDVSAAQIDAWTHGTKPVRSEEVGSGDLLRRIMLYDFGEAA